MYCNHEKFCIFAANLTMDFIGELTYLQLWLMIGSVVCIIISLIAILARTVPLRRYFNRRHELADVDRSHLVTAAVIVFVNDDAESLAEMLPGVLSQDYPAGYEVIVVNDGESADVRNIVEGLKVNHRNLYFTVAPDGARNLSRKKLALTLGVKAAKSSVVVHTTSNARIKTDKWLWNIMKHFDPEGAVDVVIGYAAAPAYDDTSFGARGRAFDSMVDALGWVGPATAGRPWRGTEHNLAYRRELFFRNKGFSHHLNLRDGDDDIYVSEIARGFNTVVELSSEAFVEVPGANGRRVFNERLARRRFTKRFISRRPRIAGTVSTIFYFLAPFPLIVCPFISFMPWIGWVYTAAILICWYATGLLYNSANRILRGRRLALSTPLLAFTRPLRIVSRTVNSVAHKGKRYTWE